MKKLPDMPWYGLEPCSWPRYDSSDVDNPTPEEWSAGLGTSEEGGGMSRAKTNGFLSNLITRQILMDMGFLPGTLFIDGNSDSLQWDLYPNVVSFPCRYSSSDGIVQSVSCRPWTTRWHRDCIMPNMSITQLESPLSYKITSSALPPPGEQGMITGTVLQMPTSGYLNIDFSIEGTNTDIEIWVCLSNQTEYSSTSVPSASRGGTGIGIDIPIVMDGQQAATMIPVSNGMYVSIFGRTGDGQVPDSIYLNLRLTPPFDMTRWR